MVGEERLEKGKERGEDREGKGGREGKELREKFRRVKVMKGREREGKKSEEEKGGISVSEEGDFV